MSESKQQTQPQFDSTHIVPKPGGTSANNNAAPAASTSAGGAAAAGGSASASATPAKSGKGGTHLTPLKGTGGGDRSLEADDTQFTEAFVRKLSPRSTEACRLLGVLPEELVLRSYENFYEHGIAPAIQKLRYQDYEQMRQETIGLVREERQTLIASGWSPAISPAAKLKIQQATLKAMTLPQAAVGGVGPGHSRNGSTHASPARLPGGLGSAPGGAKTLQKSATTGQLPDPHAHQNHGYSSQRQSVLPHLLPEEVLLEQEQERLRKTMMRQNKEIESLMAYELRSVTGAPASCCCTQLSALQAVA
jgi:hypothetical protein